MVIAEDAYYLCKNCKENILLIVGTEDNQVLVCPICDRPEGSDDES